MYIPAWVIVVAIAVLVVTVLALFGAIGEVKEKLEELQSSVDDLKVEEEEQDDDFWISSLLKNLIRNRSSASFL